MDSRIFKPAAFRFRNHPFPFLFLLTHSFPISVRSGTLIDIELKREYDELRRNSQAFLSEKASFQLNYQTSGRYMQSCLTLKEVAELLKVKPRTIYAWVKR